MKHDTNDRHTSILTVIDSLGAGGVQRHLLALCPELANNSHPTDIFSFVQQDDFYAAEIAATGTKVMFGAKRRSHVPLILARLLSVMRTGKYETVHSYLPASYLFGTCMARWLGVRNIVTTICARKEQIRSRVLSFENYGRLQSLTTRYVTSWPSQLTELGVPAEKIMHSGFATNYELEQKITQRKDNPLLSEYHLTESTPIILTVGRFHRDKGHDYTIRAHRLLMRSFPTAKLLVVGAGPDEKRLQEIARESGSRVIFCGIQRELAPFFSLANMYVNAAINEGVNLSQLQAMAFGVPTIAFDTGITEYEQAGGQGAVVRVALASVDDLALEMARVLTNPRQHDPIVERGKAFALRYDKARIVGDYLQLYESLSRATRA